MRSKFRIIYLSLSLCCITSLQAYGTESQGKELVNQIQKDLGAMSPANALEYMKKTKNLVIVDVASVSNYNRKHFNGAVNIPIENITSSEARTFYLELPKDCPIMLHCRAGAIVPGAYRTLKELRPDIPEISYINGAPLFDDYNEWYSETNLKE